MKANSIGGNHVGGFMLPQIAESTTNGAEEIRDCPEEDDGSWVTDG